jgi:nitrate reductase molybdenum cofactor assembly chaperone
MRPEVEVHDALARLLEYPREGYSETVEESVRVVTAACPTAGAALEPFLEFVHAHPLSDLEEMFTRTFDNSPDRALEVGWHTFGENYTRGTFMVRMRQRLREVGVEESSELPDHLSHVLALIGRADARWSGDMSYDTVAPAVTKIHDALNDQENPWTAVMVAVQDVLSMHEHSPRKPVGANIPSSWPPAPDEGEGMGGCGFGEEPCHE